MSDQQTGGPFAALSDYVREQMDDLHVPGVAVGVQSGDTEELGGFGVTSVENPLDVDGDTLFQIGSTSKTVTGTVAMMLVQDGKLDLDTPIREYVPELKLADEQATNSVTMKHLLSHTGGWAGDYFADSGPGDDALARIAASMIELEQLTPPGSSWAYNNAGFYLAGWVIERLTGQTYEAVVRERVFEPLGMDHSFFSAAEAITYRVAVGHTVVDGVPQVARPWYLARAANPVGGIISTARDQLRYARFSMGDGTAPDGTLLLNADAMDLMKQPIADTGRMEQVGLSWYLREAGGHRLVSHGGATNGQLSAFVMAPADRFAITVLTNANVGGELHGRVVGKALELYLGVPRSKAAHIDVDEEKLADYVGSYDAQMSTYEIRLENGGLVIQSRSKGGFPHRDSPPSPYVPPPTRAAFYGIDRLILLDPPFTDTKGDFLRDAAGRVAWLRIGGRMTRRQR